MLNPKDFKKEAGPVVDWIDRYLNQIQSYPVKSKVAPGDIYKAIPESAPLRSEPMNRIMEDMDRLILPGMTHWQHQGFHAYFPANSSVESVLAESLTAAMAAQCMIWDTSPAAAELEQRMMEWLRNAMGMPSNLEGVIQDSASSATLVSLITAREVATGFRSNKEGVPSNLRVYCSTETHSSIEKGVAVSGIGTNNLVKVGTDSRMRMNVAELEQKIREDLENGMKPCAVVATLGTTGTVAVDPLKEISGICKKYGVWLHVDAAFAGTALLLPEYRWMIEGIEQADTFVFNPHKWMFTNFDCSVYLVKDAGTLIRTFEILPEYLKTKTRGAVNDYRDWGIQLGRRFRALKLWFVIRSYGLDGIREKLKEHIRLNKKFSQALRKIEHMQIPMEPFLNFTCFRLHPPGMDASDQLNRLNEAFLEEINRDGTQFLTHTRVNGLHTLRMIIGQTYVEEKDVDRALKLISSAAAETLKRYHG
jgi:aromatic-L-amino-acid decarboxylase